MRDFEFVERLKDEHEGYWRLPERATKGSAGYDFYNPKRIVCKSHEITMIPTGIKAKMSSDEVLLLFNRSSNPKKKGLIIPNSVGVIDSDYYDNEDNEGEIAFAFYNINDTDTIITQGEKLGQGVFMQYGITMNDNAKGKRAGGFGSTDNVTISGNGITLMGNNPF
jgi:dUTP pyrophosphatase